MFSRYGSVKYSQMDISIVGLLMDQIPEPGFLIDLTHKSIVQVNGELITITGFSHEELCSASIDALIRNIIDIDFDQNEFQIELSRKNKTTLQVQAKVIQLVPKSKMILIELLGFNKRADKNQITLSSITKIFEFSYDQTKEEYLKRVLEELESIFTNATINLYLHNQEKKVYCKLNRNKSKSIFPDIYSNNDIETINTPEIWKPGKRVMNGFQRLARVNDLASLILYPMINQDEISGFIIVSEKNETIPNLDLDTWTTITEIIDRTIISFDQYKRLASENLDKAKQNKILNEIFENISVGVMHIKDNHIKQINSYTEQVLGYSKWEIENIPINELFSGNENLINNLNPINTINAQLTTILHRRDGIEIRVLIQIIPIEYSEPSGQTNEVLVLFTDLSEIEKLQSKTKQLEQQALVGIMMAYFAHDVRNIVNSIQIGVNTSKLKIGSGNIDALSMTGIEEDCDRIILLMESILSYSRSLESTMESVEIVGFLQRLLDRMQPKLEKFNIKTIFQVEADIPLISGDTRSLEQVFSNLINNAKDAMEEEGGTLAINVNCEGMKNEKMVTIKMTDTGPGIPDDLISKLFEPYITTRTSGTGLGLVISKQIILAHKGKIHVTSFPGGTTFTISIPANTTE